MLLPPLAAATSPAWTPRRCDPPVLSGASLNTAEGPQLQWRQSGNSSDSAPPSSVPPVRFSAPLVLFIAALGLALSVGASLLTLPPLTLADLATSPYLPTRALLAMRASFALVVGLSLRSSLADPEPVRFSLITYAGTRLPPRTSNFRGLERLTTYTVQCWALQLAYFSVATAATALKLAGVGAAAVPLGLARAVHVLCAHMPFELGTH